MATAFTPDEEVKIHEHAVKLLCASFQSHENGLPEWVKNAADEYLRRGDADARRVIVVLLTNGHGQTLPSIACLDFCGMTSATIDEKYRYWADPEAAQAKDEEVVIQGGHGNGGKCYSAQMFTESASLITVSNGKRNRYGTVGTGNYQFGYFPDPESGKDVAVDDLSVALEEALAEIGATPDLLPPVALEVLEAGDGFTLAAGIGPKGLKNRLPVKSLLEEMRDHASMQTSLELCSVYVVGNGQVQEDGQPIKPSEIPPLEGGETPRTVAMPDTLTDPVTGDPVSTTGDGTIPAGHLELRTSEKSMRHSKKARHRVTYRAGKSPVGFKPILDFDVSSSYRDRIYGEVSLASFTDYKLNMRGPLAEAPLTRAVDAWIAREIEEYARGFEARDRRKHSEEEKNAVAEMNDALDRWKNDLIDRVMTEGGPGGDDPPPPPPPLPSGVPVKIDLSVSHARAGVGVPLRPKLQFFDSDGKRIRSVPVDWSSSDPNVGLVDADLNVLSTFTPGTVTIQATTLDGSLSSNPLTIEVVLIDRITIVPDEIEVPVGSRRRLEANCTLRSGEVTNSVMLIWQEQDSSVANASAAGMVFGFEVGETEVTAMDDRCEADTSAKVTVVPPDEGTGDDDGDGRGSGYPRVMISEYQDDPDDGEPVNLSPDDPPVYQRAQDVDRNIWWINAAAPLARIYLDEAKGYGFETREWRIYHTDRFIDVIVQILLVSDPDSQDDASAGDWIGRWGQRASEIQVSAAKGLASFISDGELPEG